MHTSGAEGVGTQEQVQINVSSLLTSTSDAIGILQGIRMFRMERNEEFLRLMLQHISLLYTEHVMLRRAPPLDLHWRSPDYQQLLHLTLRISAETPALAHVIDPACSPFCDQRAFL